MPLVQREVVVPTRGPRVKTPRSDEHALCGTVVRVRQNQDGWTLAAESEDYEHATIEQVININGTEYAECNVRGPDRLLIACLAIPVSHLPQYIVTSS